LEENRSLHFPLTGEEGLPARTGLDEVKVAPLGLAGGAGTTEGREAEAGEDGGEDEPKSSSEQEKSRCSSPSSSSSEQSTSWNPSRDAFEMSTGDPSAFRAELEAAPLEGMTEGEGGRSVLGTWEIAPSSVPRADLRPRTSEPPWLE
jgi:hypothetical protein